MDIPFNDLKRGYELYKNEYEARSLEVLRSGWYILGQEVKCFEEEFSAANNARYCIGVDNGLNAISLSLRALEIGAGDEVIIQANTYIATVLAVTHNQATPVFVEPDEFFNMDVGRIEERITSKTKAILVTHLYGQASKMDKIVKMCIKYGLQLVEDCAQAHFAQYKNQYVGTFGQLGCYSFYPTKNLGGFGDGGAVVTNDVDLANKIRMLRNYGSSTKYHNEVAGFNCRLDEIQAGLLRVKLNHYKELCEHRSRIAQHYRSRIHNPLVKLPDIRNESNSIWHLFVVRVENRSQFRNYLNEWGIMTDVHYPIPPHLSDAYTGLGYKKGDFPIAEEYANTVVSIPLFDGMSMSEADFVIEKINQYQNRG